MKRCRKCGETKPLDDFHKSANSPDGRQYRCKICAITAAHQWQMEHPDAARKSDQNYRATEKYKAARKTRRDGPQRERILEQKRESHARHRDKNNATSRRYHDENADRIREQRHRYYINNRDTVLDRNAKWQRDNIEHLRAYRRMRAYGITSEHLERLVAEQSGLCAICGLEMVERPLLAGMRTGICVDHDHETGAIRGLLCAPCNSAIGLLNDNIDLVRAALIYLELHQLD